MLVGDFVKGPPDKIICNREIILCVSWLYLSIGKPIIAMAVDIEIIAKSVSYVALRAAKVGVGAHLMLNKCSPRGRSIVDD